MDACRYLNEIREEFQKIRDLAENAVAQVEEKDWFVTPGADSNSIAILMKHMAGNMRSRWTDFLTSDGEKEDRHRDAEFETSLGETRATVAAAWDAGWKCLFDTLLALQPEDLDRTVPIRGEAHSVTRALHRQLSHYAYHVGQITWLAKHLAGPRWKTLSIPRRQSERFLRNPNFRSSF